MVLKMKNTSLYSIISYANDSRELQTYFYQLSSDMKDLHNKGIFITDFQPSNIHYNDGGFSFLAEKVDDDKKSEVLLSNIYDCALLMLKTYAYKNGIGDIVNKISKDTISNIFPEIQHVFLEEDGGYFKQIFETGDTIYYHDYINKYDQLLGEGKGEHKNFVKATSVGSMLTEKDSINKAAFISVPAVFIMAGILIIIMILIYALFIIKY